MKKKSNKSSVPTTLGKNIKYIRSLKGISQEKLAEKINKSAHFVSLIEREESGLSVNTIIDICIALNIDANTLFNGIIPSSNDDINSNVISSFNSFNKKDKEMLTYLINYITDKNNIK